MLFLRGREEEGIEILKNIDIFQVLIKINAYWTTYWFLLFVLLKCDLFSLWFDQTYFN